MVFTVISFLNIAVAKGSSTLIWDELDARLRVKAWAESNPGCNGGCFKHHRVGISQLQNSFLECDHHDHDHDLIPIIMTV